MLTPIAYFIVVTGVAECIADALDANQVEWGTLGRPARVTGVPGPEVPWDGCDCKTGQLAVAIQHGPYRSERFPTETVDSAQTSGCFADTTAVRMVASLTRCQYHPQGTQTGTPPTVAQQTEALRLQVVEGTIMRNALLCCLGQMEQDGLIDDWNVGANDSAVNGACGEVSIVFTVQVI